MREGGFTLIELLVVVAIIAVGWFTLLPNLNLAERGDDVDPHLTELNAFLGEVRGLAQSEGRRRFVRVEVELDLLVSGEQSVRLPAPVAEVRVNGSEKKIPPHFVIYRDGIMDEVMLTLASGTVWKSEPLHGRFQ